MSEYQYYEFQAIDRPLGGADQEALRALSTRARITATSFTNSYEILSKRARTAAVPTFLKISPRYFGWIATFLRSQMFF